jgi:hypothetical protein
VLFGWKNILPKAPRMRIRAIMDRIFRSCLVKDKDMMFP